MANISDIAYMTVRLTETATGNHPKFSIVGQDGNPYTQVGRPVYGDGTTLDIPPASRYAIAVTMPKEGDLSWNSPPDPGAKPIVNPGVLYTNNGTKNPPAVLGTLTVDPKYISYADGFFVFPTQTLISATPDTSGRADHGLRAGPEPRRLHVVRGHLGDDARRQAGADDRRRLRQRQGQQQRPQGRHLPVRRQHIPEHPADPAAAELRGGVADHQLQQRRAPDAHPRQRLPGDGDRRPEPGQDRRAAVGRRQRQRARADIRRRARRRARRLRSRCGRNSSNSPAPT